MSIRNNDIDFSVDYESMSTEQLEALLTQELAQDSFDNSQMIEKVTDILIEREPEKYDVDVEKAYASFLNDYQYAESLYEDEDEGVTDYRYKQIKPAKEKRPRPKFGFARAACVAVVTVVLIFVSSMTAYAFGYDIWGKMANWTSETFRFNSGNTAGYNSGDKDVPDVLQEFKELAAKNGLPDSVLPGWLPDGYSVVEMKNYCTEDYVNIFCALENDDSPYITFQYIIHFTDEYGREYQKDDIEPEIYEHNGIEYAILTNMGEYYAVWLNGNIECSISGFNSREELIKVINSI